MKSCKVLDPLNHDSIAYFPGDSIDLPTEVAEALADLKVVEIIGAAEPKEPIASSEDITEDLGEDGADGEEPKTRRARK